MSKTPPDPVPDEGAAEEVDEEWETYQLGQVENRRELVWEMMIQGVPVLRMAEELGVSRHVVMDDINAIKQDVASGLEDCRKGDRSRIAEEVGSLTKRLDWIFHNAAMEYAATNSASAKDKFLNTCLKATISKERILVETGFIPKPGVKIDVEVTERGSFIDMFGEKGKLLEDPVNRRKAIEAAYRLLNARGSHAARTVEARVKPAKAIEKDE